MKTLNTSLVALALLASGTSMAFAGGDPATNYTDSYSNSYVVRTHDRSYDEPGWVRERPDRSNYHMDRQSYDTTRLNNAGIRASQR